MIAKQQQACKVFKLSIIQSNVRISKTTYIVSVFTVVDTSTVALK